jgi:GT2 family glycosyltransferase
MHTKNIFIVIPVHNRKHFTRACLLSIRKQTLPNFKVIVVDDGSTDGTGEMIEEGFPDVILLKGDDNLWWTGDTNIGVEYALEQADHDDYIYLHCMYDDTIVRPAYLQTLLDTALNHPKQFNRINSHK